MLVDVRLRLAMGLLPPLRQKENGPCGILPQGPDFLGGGDGN
jgi:hypothetical protein